MNGDEQVLNGRVYGAEHDDPNPGPFPHRTYAELVGGPLDGRAGCSVRVNRRIHLPPVAQRSHNGVGQQACGHLAVHRVRTLLATLLVLFGHEPFPA
ncbi:hypothetical protein [Streptomyces puniciscabiei]|uniref:hypothetical protein n=1 Tax=Streptomyces puniciscabiei TaxID=164348 RepID=UPI00333128EE